MENEYITQPVIAKREGNLYAVRQGVKLLGYADNVKKGDTVRVCRKPVFPGPVLPPSEIVTIEGVEE